MVAILRLLERRFCFRDCGGGFGCVVLGEVGSGVMLSMLIFFFGASRMSEG